MSIALQNFFDDEIKNSLDFVNKQNLKNVRELLSIIPNESLYYMLCYEIIPNKDSAKMDFFSGASVRNPYGNEILKSLFHNFKIKYENDKSWETALKSLEYISEHPESSLIDHIWLEFDTSQHALFLPSIFWGIRPEDYKRNIKLQQLTEFIKTYFNVEITTEALKFLNAINNFCLYGIGITHLGVMSARNNSNLRVLINNIPSENINSILSYLCKFKELKIIYKLIKEYSPFFDYFSLQLELSETGSTGGVGLECYHFDRPLHFRKRIGKMTLDKLASQGYILEYFIDNVINFEAIRDINSEFFLTNNLGKIPPIKIKKKIHHYKFNIFEDEVKLKIYLSSECNWKQKKD